MDRRSSVEKGTSAVGKRPGFIPTIAERVRGCVTKDIWTNKSDVPPARVH